MGRYRDEAPIGNTCPIIDEAIGSIQCIEMEEEFVTYADTAIAKLETIRKANETLRSWGNELCEEKNEFEKELDASQQRVIELEQTIDDLKDRIVELEEELQETEDARSDAVAELENLQII